MQKHIRSVKIVLTLMTALLLVLPACDTSSSGDDGKSKNGGKKKDGDEEDASVDAAADTDSDTDGDSDSDTDADSDSDTDSDSDSDSDTHLPDPAVIGRIEVYESIWEYGGGSARADFYDAPVRMDAFSPYAPDMHEEKIRQDDCVLFVAAQNQCNPPCDWEEYCNSNSECVSFPQRITVGRITITGLAQPCSMDPDPGGWDAYWDTLPDNAFDEGAQITAEAQGDDLDAFSLSVTGVGVLDDPVDGQNLTLVDGKDNEITWTPQDNGFVQLLLNLGWHGAPPEATLICETDASEGRMIIPREVVEATPPAGGVGLEPHSSWVSLMNRDRLELDEGTVEFVVQYRHMIYWEH